MRCDLCQVKGCCEENPCLSKDSLPLYSDENEAKIMRVAAAVEAEFYGEYNRIQEIMVFSSRMGYKKLGLAFCSGLSEEAEKLCQVLSQYFAVESACCKICGIPKNVMGVPSSDRVGNVSCNPIEQARTLEEAGTELNLLLGLCVGHDAIFIKHSHTYVIPVAAKDRVMGHNPLAALYASVPFKKLKKNFLGQQS